MVKFFHCCLSVILQLSFCHPPTAPLHICQHATARRAAVLYLKQTTSWFQHLKYIYIGGAAANGWHEGKLITFAWWRKKKSETSWVSHALTWPQQNINLIHSQLCSCAQGVERDKWWLSSLTLKMFTSTGGDTSVTWSSTKTGNLSLVLWHLKGVKGR